MKRGRPFEPGNKFGRGRPKGSRNKKTLAAQQIFENNAAAIISLAIHQCRDHPAMLKMLASHLIPRQKPAPVKIGPLPMDTLEDLERANKLIAQKAASGKLSLNEAQQLSNLIDDRRRLPESREFERRLQAMESVVGRLAPEPSEAT